MKIKIIIFSFCLFLGASLVLAENFYAQIIEPDYGEIISKSKLADNHLLENDVIFEIKGISKPQTTNKISVYTIIPELIKNFSAEINKETKQINLNWQKREIFQDNLQVIERHEYFTLPDITASFCPDELSYKTECTTEENEKFYRECKINYNCTLYWQGYNNNQETEIIKAEYNSGSAPNTTSKPSISPGSIKGIYKYKLFFKKEPILSETEQGQLPCQPPSCADFAPKTTVEPLNFDQEVLLDDFEHYEIWYNIEKDSELPYLYNIGVQRDENISRKIDININDPHNNKITLSFQDFFWIDENGTKKPFSSTENLHISLFEIQRIDTEKKLIDENGYIIGSKNPQGGNEIFIKNQEVIYPGFSQIKIEKEIKETIVISDKNGEFTLPAINILKLNPLSYIHSIVAVYENKINQKSSTGFYLISNKKAEENNINPLIYTKGSFYRSESEPFGTIFNAWTLMPIKKAVINCIGKSNSNEEIIYQQSTNQDGFYSFSVPQGIYILEPEITGGILNKPTETGPYTHLYQSEQLKIRGDNVHKDIAIMPSIFGYAEVNSTITLKNTEEKVIKTTKANQQGKFYFFVENGDYLVNNQPVSAPILEAINLQ